MAKKRYTPEEIVRHFDSTNPATAELCGIVEIDGVTPRQRKMLMVEALPESYRWTVAEKAALAGVSVSYWEKFCKTKLFTEKSVEIAQQLFGKKILQVFNAFIRKALHGEKDGFGDRAAQEIILRKCGVLGDNDKNSDSGTTNHYHGDINVATYVGNLDGDEREQLRANLRVPFRR